MLWLRCLMLTILMVSQAQLVDGQSFMRRYDTWGQFRSESGFGIEVRSDGTGYIVFLGSEFSDSLFYSSVVSTLHIDLYGTTIDTNRVVDPFHATYPGHANASFPLEGGGYGIGGSNFHSDGTQRPVLYLFDSLGVTTEYHEYGVQGENWIGRQGKQTPDGGYIIVGETSSSGTSLDAFVLKIDSLYDQEWIQTYGSTNLREYANSVDMAPNGGYYIGGQQEVSPGNYDQRVFCVDYTGSLVWDETYGGPYHDANAEITTLADSNLVFSSAWGVNNSTYLDLGLAKVDPAGDLIWMQTYDGSAFASTLFTVKEISPGGDLIAAGFSYRPGYLQGAMVRTTANGDSLWMRYYHYYDSLWTEGKGSFRDVIPTPDGGFIAVGAAYGSNNPNDPPAYGQDTWVVKVDSMGCLVPGCDTVTGIESYATNLKDALTVAPNPTRDVVRLSWQLPQGLHRGKATLSVVNSAGGLVRTEELELSQNSYQIDVSDWASGIYYLHLVSEGVWVTGGKLVVR